MATPADKLLPCIIHGVTVPCKKIRVRGGMRDHEHIYPHSPGAGCELLGRELYKIEIVPVFDARMLSPKYRNLWPAGLKKIRDKFEAGERSGCSIPTVGVIRCYAKNWEQEFDAVRSLSGEDVLWNLTEDSENLRLSSSAVNIGNGFDIAAKNLGAFVSAMPKKSTNLWDLVMKAIDSVLAYRDQYELYASLIEAKLLAILSMLDTIDNIADELKDPSSWALLEALHQVWQQARAFYQDQKQMGLVTKWYTTKVLMSSMQLAIVLFGDTTKSSELLALNGFVDPFAIPAGTRVRYYQIEQMAA